MLLLACLLLARVGLLRHVDVSLFPAVSARALCSRLKFPVFQRWDTPRAGDAGIGVSLWL